MGDDRCIDRLGCLDSSQENKTVTGIVGSNTTPLIYLAKEDDPHILKKLFENIYIPTEVYREAVESGLARGYSDASFENYI